MAVTTTWSILDMRKKESSESVNAESVIDNATTITELKAAWNSDLFEDNLYAQE
jgi:hypothetical protein